MQIKWQRDLIIVFRPETTRESRKTYTKASDVENMTYFKPGKKENETFEPAIDSFKPCLLVRTFTFNNPKLKRNCKFNIFKLGKTTKKGKSTSRQQNYQHKLFDCVNCVKKVIRGKHICKLNII